LIEAQRKRVATEFRKLLDRFAKDKGKNARKEALLYIRQTYGTPERTVYDWCKKFGVSTR
jgi:hypothetical protein